MGTAEAAARLRVSQRQVERLLAAGTLKAAGQVGRTLLVDPLSVARLAQSRARRGRPLSAAAAWGLLFAWDGREVAGMTPAQWRNVRALLPAVAVEDLDALTRNRAHVLVLRASPSYLEDLRARLILSGSAPLRVALTPDPNSVDGYVDRARADELVKDYGLVADPGGNVTLRVLADGAPALDGHVPAAVAAVDLSSSLDPREREAGLGVLRSLRVPTAGR